MTAERSRPRAGPEGLTPITDLLVCANGPGLLESRLDIALQVAGAFRSHIEVVFFQEAQDPATVPVMGPAFNYSTEHDVAQSRWEKEAGQITRAKDTFHRWMASNNVASISPPASASAHSASWSEVAGRAADLFPSRAKACDLIVAGGPSADASSLTLDDEISAMALLSSGRMTLLAPSPAHGRSDLFRNVLIAWDDSAAVSRTLAQALPLIAAAKKVTLFIGETSPDSVTPCNDILAYLRRKGIQPEVSRSVPILHTIRETLVRQAREQGVSLIVMGSYKHSRTREILFGGTTRYVIQHAGCAVLMAN